MDKSRRKFNLGMGAAMAATAAGLTGVAGTAVAGEKGQVHCYGVNKCKGHNDCKTANNACKGMASCKGQGYVKMSASACDAIGGTAKDD